MDRLVEVAFNVPVDRTFTYLSAEGAERLPIGSRVVAPFGRRSIAGFVVGYPDAAPDGVVLKTITRSANELPLFDAGFLELARWVKRMYYCSLGETLAAMIPGGRREVSLPSIADDVAASQTELELSAEQASALEAVFASPTGLYYLYGVTGSGKTEVFLQAAERTIASGRSVIYLVPEIALTHQLLDAVRHRFDGRVAVLHSRLTPSQRLTEWHRIRRGEARLVVGARSAVFAPVGDLGLIVLDEEHDGSYKSGSAPRYHARQVAMKRVAEAGGRMMMGSATPSVEAWHLMDSGAIVRLSLSQRLSGGAMPSLEIVDLKKDPGPLSQRLIAAMRETHTAGRQSILFLNRRGFAHFFHCRTCGYEMRCERCSVGMTYHKERDLMVCHYCGYRVRPVSQCPECGSLDVGYSGFGTERIGEDLERLFPEWSIARLDTDTARRRGVLERTIEEFRAGKIDVLLGTQMVAKGLNFPGVQLVGIVLADTGLHMPDFRAAERTFGLVVQVAGRAGRFHPDGRVIVQTYAPENGAIARAVTGDLDGFYANELAARRELAFPPFSRFIRMVIRGGDRAAVARDADELGRRCVARLRSAEEILGPSECPLSVIAGNVRHQVIVRTNRFGATHQELAALLSGYTPSAGVYAEVDVDPVSLL
ncbi:MAG: primosomal protein N' [Spirochaetaceae bacterium]|nr:MAG: primosomal protein N' [Spirochaetaceae bacterium]